MLQPHNVLWQFFQIWPMTAADVSCHVNSVVIMNGLLNRNFFQFLELRWL